MTEPDCHPENEQTISDSRNRRSTQWLISLGAVIFICLAWITWESGPFRVDRESNLLLPIRLIVGLYIAATFASVAAYFVARNIDGKQIRLVPVIVAFALAFRLIQLLSTPILEVDHYRYMWDGIVSNRGLSPYRYSPLRVQNFDSIDDDDALLRQYSELGRSSNSRSKILKTVHFPKYTTIYPPVSQAVFAATMRLVPADASVAVHLWAMKIALLLFDLGIIVVLLLLAKQLNYHLAVVLAYAWNPLVVKETANSAHLDSIAVFFCTLAIYFAARMVANTSSGMEGKSRSAGLHLAIFSAVSLGLGVGAKVFPVILFPLLAWTIWRWIGPKAAFVYSFVFALTATAAFGPMLLEIRRNNPQPPEVVRPEQANSPIASGANRRENQTESNEGLSAFLSKWRMNDIVFSVIHENLNPAIRSGDRARPWYVVTSDEFRKSVHQRVQPWTRQASTQYFLARLLTMVLFGLGYFLVLRKVSKVKKLEDQQRPDVLLESAFLILAWFFLLQPTQNPWYWLWALPLVGFAKNWSWLFVSPLLFVYYLRFWFQGLTGKFHFFGFEYSGVSFFDHCVVWLEYLPVMFLWVAVTILPSLNSPESE